MTEIEDVLARFTRAKTRKEPWKLLVEKAFAYARPRYYLWTDVTDNETTNNNYTVFDSTGMTALDSFVSNLQSSLVPPVKEWIRLKCGNAVAEDNRDASDKVLEGITKTIFDFIRISNFDTEVSKSFADFSAGVGSLMLNKGTKDNPLHFSSVSSREIVMEEGAFGRVDTIYRHSRVPMRAVQQMWPDATLPDGWTERVDKKEDERVCIVEAFIPGKIKKSDLKKGEVVEANGYTYWVILEEEKTQLVKREQESSPWIVFRWPGMPNEVYPQGPLLKALPDILTINKVKELLLKKGSRDVYGLYTYLDDGVINIENINFAATCFIPVESNGGARGKSIEALPATGDLNLAQFLFNDLQNAINKTMFAEPLGRVDAPVKTATEIAYRQAELAKKIGSAFGQLQHEFLNPLINRILYILDEMNLIDLGDYKVDGRVININYQSPLAQAQDQDDFIAASRYVETVQALYGPTIAMGMAPPNRFGLYFAEKLHVPKELVPTEQEIMQMVQAASKAAAAQNQPPAPQENNGPVKSQDVGPVGEVA